MEIAVDTAEAAEAAERGGADRIELCGELSVGGVSPDLALIRAVRKQIQIPIFVMIRPRADNFVYSPSELAQMTQSIAAAKELGVNGLVLGIFTSHGRVDMERTSELVALAAPLPVTFHRAFDVTINLEQALEDVVQTGASRILTSGGAATAVEGAPRIASLVAAAGERITIVPGAGIHAGNILQIAAVTRAREFHSGLSSALPYPRTNYSQFENEVRKMITGLRTLSEPDNSHQGGS